MSAPILSLHASTLGTFPKTDPRLLSRILSQIYLHFTLVYCIYPDINV
jgi:hypothetical protein